MLLMAHVQKNNIKDYWSISILLSTAIFGKVMTQDRFLLLLRLLHFSDNRNLLPGSTYQPHLKVCINESIVVWKGRL